MNRYAKYKSSGFDWIGEIPSHWMVRRVSTFGEFFKGRGIRKDETKSVGLPCIRYGEIYTKYDRIVFNTTSFIDEETSKESELIKKGDVLFAGSGETTEDIGKAIVYFGVSDAYAGGDTIVLRLQDAIDPIYASFLMNASFVQHQKSISARGEIIVHIYPKDIR
jgi:type I restriction enzyme S subunit